VASSHVRGSRKPARGCRGSKINSKEPWGKKPMHSSSGNVRRRDCATKHNWKGSFEAVVFSLNHVALFTANEKRGIKRLPKTAPPAAALHGEGNLSSKRKKRRTRLCIHSVENPATERVCEEASGGGGGKEALDPPVARSHRKKKRGLPSGRGTHALFLL